MQVIRISFGCLLTLTDLRAVASASVTAPLCSADARRQAAKDSVELVISRLTRVQTPDILRSSPSKESLLNFSVYATDGLFSYYPFKEFPQKLVTITKVRHVCI